MELFSSREGTTVSAQVVSCCGLRTTKKSLQHTHSHIPHMFDHWADPVVHLLLLKSSLPMSNFDKQTEEASSSGRR